MSDLDRQDYISPNYLAKKLESPNFIDLVEVYEDRMNGIFFEPISTLINHKSKIEGTFFFDMPAAALMFSYFEGIEIYFTGMDSRYKSREFFTRGFGRVFLNFNPQPPELKDKVAGQLYGEARCGLAHVGMSSYKVFYSREFEEEPFHLTWPKKNGVIDLSGDVKSIIINSPELLKSIKNHFDKYIGTLKNNPDAAVRDAFLKAMNLTSGLDRPAPLVLY